MSIIGSGQLGVNSKQVPPGTFPAGAADNGLSVDPVTGHIVLGADFGDPAGMLLSDREIYLSTRIFKLTTQFGNDLLNLNGSSGEMIIGDLIGHGSAFTTSVFGEASIFSANNPVFYSDGTQTNLRVQNVNKISTFTTGIDIGDQLNGIPLMQFSNANDLRLYDGAGAVLGLQMDFPTTEYNFGSVSGGNGTFVSVQDLAFIKEIVLNADNGIRTSDPGGGIISGAWKLGARKAAAVVFDATQYLEVKVNGTNFRLGLVN